jgi:hypothetical protein
VATNSWIWTLTRITLQKYNTSATLLVSYRNTSFCIKIFSNTFQNLLSKRKYYNFLNNILIIGGTFFAFMYFSLNVQCIVSNACILWFLTIKPFKYFEIENRILNFEYSGYSGIFLCGDLPYWLFLTTHGALRTHPMYLDGKVSRSVGDRSPLVAIFLQTVFLWTVILNSPLKDCHLLLIQKKGLPFKEGLP